MAKESAIHSLSPPLPMTLISKKYVSSALSSLLLISFTFLVWGSALSDRLLQNGWYYLHYFYGALTYALCCAGYLQVKSISRQTAVSRFRARPTACSTAAMMLIMELMCAGYFEFNKGDEFQKMMFNYVQQFRHHDTEALSHRLGNATHSAFFTATASDIYKRALIGTFLSYMLGPLIHLYSLMFVIYQFIRVDRGVLCELRVLQAERDVKISEPLVSVHYDKGEFKKLSVSVDVASKTSTHTTKREYSVRNQRDADQMRAFIEAVRAKNGVVVEKPATIEKRALDVD